MSKPTVWYGMHFYPGTAEYKEADGSVFRVFLNEDTIRSMDESFVGCPVYLEHVDEVDFSNEKKLKNEADGYVMRSFYCEADGKHWAQFIVTTDRAMTAIQQGYKLSNAYVVKGYSSGGVWNGIDYQKEVVGGTYEHLALVKRPRYSESEILSPEQFKQYCDEKKKELSRVANSQGEPKMKFELFKSKREKIENDLNDVSTILPTSKKQVTVAEALEHYDKFLNMHGYAADEHMVKVNDKDEMSVKELRDSYGKMCQERDQADIDAKAKEESGEGDLDPDKKKNDDEDMEEEEKKKKANEELNKPPAAKEMDANKKVNALENEIKKLRAEVLRNAHKRGEIEEVDEKPIDLAVDQVARGKSRYGSK